MRRDVRILLVGDGVCVHPGRVYLLTLGIPADGVGKSTIITSLIKESFVAHV